MFPQLFLRPLGYLVLVRASGSGRGEPSPPTLGLGGEQLLLDVLPSRKGVRKEKVSVGHGHSILAEICLQ